MENESIRIVKCVFVGDAQVGKTSLIVSYTTNGYPHKYVPTVSDNYSVVVQVDKKPINLQLCDTAGQSEFDTLRPLSYPESDVIIIVYSVVNPESFHSITEHWIPEVNRGSPGTGVILVGTQADIRWKYNKSSISTMKGKQLANQLGAEFFECSALTQTNLKQMFDAAILTGLEGKKTLKSSKNIHPSSRFKQSFQRFMNITRKLI